MRDEDIQLEPLLGDRDDLCETAERGVRPGQKDDDEDNNTEEDAIQDLEATNSSPKTRFVGRLLLVTVAFLYGTLNISFRFLYGRPQPPAPSTVSMVRGWMSLVCFLPLWMDSKRSKDYSSTENNEEVAVHIEGQEENTDDWTGGADPSELSTGLWKAAGELAVWNFTSQALCSLGLLTTPSARTSFLGQTAVVMVPLFLAFSGERLRPIVWVGCLASFVGLAVLSWEGTKKTDGTESTGLGMGDVLVLSGTVTWSMYVIRLAKLSKSFDAVSLQGTKTFCLAVSYTAWFVTSTIRTESCLWLGWHDLVAWAILAYSSMAPGVGADLLQQLGQERVPTAESNLIMCIEPVFTTVLGRLILGEETSLLEKLGGGCLIAGALVSSG